MRDQLTKSLVRLQTDYIDTYLLHNPEYYLLHTIKHESDLQQHRSLMMERIFEAFVALEKEVQNGRIKSYGISSNSFSKSMNDLHFLPYEGLIILAERAAKEAGAMNHHFTTIQLPINLLEQEGLACAKWAKSQGLKVLVNRPLNAFDKTGMHRLATYAKPPNYKDDLDQLMMLADNYSLSEVRSVVQDLDAMLHKFDWVGSAENVLYTKAVPFLRGILKRVEKEVQLAFQQALERYFQSYLTEVKHLTSSRTMAHLKEKGIEVEGDLSCFALNWLAEHKEIDVILVGLRQTAYVQQVLEC